MPKRRRSETDTFDYDTVNTSARVYGNQRAQADGVIEIGKKTLFKALKTARGFERQKLGRRQKSARAANNQEDIERLAAEVAALKSLDLAAITEHHLYKSLLRTKSIASSSALPAYVALETNVNNNALNAAHRNVIARLYNSNPVKIVMKEIMATVRRALAIELPEFTEKKIQHVNSSGNGDTHNTAVRNMEISEQGPPEPDLHLTMHDKHDWSGISEQSSVDKPSAANFEHYGQYYSRLADSATDDDLSEDDTANKNTVTRPSSTRTRQSSLSPMRSSLPSGTATEPPNRYKSAEATKSTTFLPSLTLGGYWSNTDSTASDSDFGVADIKARKNRMGQQARRQLWEKKFGHKANHLKKQSRDQGWDLKKGTQSGHDRRSRAGARGGNNNRTKSSQHRAYTHITSGANGDPIGVRHDKPAQTAKVDGPLHPSWVAAKKMKQIKRAVTFEGKKIVFD